MTSFFHKLYHKRYHGIYQHAQQLFVFDLVLLGLAIAFFGASIFFFFWKPGTTGLVDFSISLGTSRIKSGERVELSATYTNRNKFTLHQAAITLRLPPGFIIDYSTISSSTFSAENGFTLPDIKPGAKGSVVLPGILWTTPNSEIKIIGTLSYRADGHTSTEQKLSSTLVELPASIVVSSFSSASSSFPNQPLPYTISIFNSRSTDVPNISIVTNWKQSTLEKEKFENIFLKGGETKTFTGTLTIPTSATTFNAQVVPTITVGKQPIPLGRNTQSISLIKPEVNLTTDFPTSPPFINSGDELPLHITWRNNSSFAFSNAQIRLHFNTHAVNLIATAKNNRLTVDHEDLIINNLARTALTAPKPGATDDFIINLQLAKNFASSDPTNNQLTVSPTWEASTELVSGQLLKQSSAPLSIQMATDFSGKNEIRYYTAEGDQLGRGPLPPRVGETTKYWIFLTLNNTVNAVDNVSVNIPLAPGVAFTGKQSVTIGPELTYSADTRTVHWNFRELPAQSQTGLYFEVSVSPSPQQIGNILSITKEITVHAEDTVVGKIFDTKLPALSNQLASDDRGAKFGAAVSAP